MEDLFGLIAIIVFAVINMLAQGAKKKRQRESKPAEPGQEAPKTQPSSLEQFFEFVKATPAPSKSDEKYDMRIVSIDMTGNEAVAKVEDLYLGFRFTDYLSLLNIEGTWVIINKTFYHEPKE